MNKPCFIAIDIEATGPIPGIYSMYEVGAVSIHEPSREYEVLIQMTTPHSSLDALDAVGTTMETIRGRENQLSPIDAMKSLAEWIDSVARAGEQPIMVAINAPFDFMFLAYYFHAYLGENPFGYTALDLKSYFAGKDGVPWERTTKRDMDARYKGTLPHTHRALDDAKKVRELFLLMTHYT